MRNAAVLGLGLMVVAPALWAGADPGPLPVQPDVVRVVRDDFGVPHVFAATREGLAFGAGWAAAEDRLFQGDVFRRAGKGTLAELLGPSQLGYDLAWRSLKYTEAERWEAFLAMPQDLQRMVWAYCAGMNAHIAAALADPVHRLPVEYAALGMAPEPWKPTDFVAIVQLQVDRFGEGGGGELGNAAFLGRLVQRFGAAEGWRVFNDAKWLNDPGAPTSIPGSPTGGEAPEPPPRILAMAAAGAFEKPLQDLLALAEPVAAAKRELGLPRFGSNAFIASPSISEGGFGLLYGGPQVGYNVPGLFLELGLHGAGIEAVGLSFAGVGPFIPIGHSGFMAWTTTSGASDTVDVFIETIRAHPTLPEQYQYLRDGQWVDMERRLEVALAKPTALELAKAVAPQVASRWVYRTLHGPVFSLDAANGVAYALQSSFWKRELDTAHGFGRYQEARSVQEYVESTARIVSSHNILVADTQGDTYYAHAGLYPVRGPGVDPRLPALGTGEQDWQGFVPFAEQPQALDPAQGWVASWNNKPRPDWGDGDDTTYGVEHRVQALSDRIQALLTQDGKLSAADFAEVGRYGAAVEWVPRYFAGYMEEARPLAGSAAQQAIDRVLAWDGERRDLDADGKYDGPAITIFREFHEQLRRRVLADELGPDLGRGSTSMLLHALAGAQASLPPSRDYLNGVPRAQVVAQAMEGAVAALQARFGTPAQELWLTPVRMQGFGPLGAASVPSIPWVNRGSYVQIVELSQVPEGVDINPPGQSGLVNATMLLQNLQQGTPWGALNKHLDDQRLLYRDFVYKPMRFTRDEIEASKESETLLVFAGLGG